MHLRRFPEFEPQPLYLPLPVPRDPAHEAGEREEPDDEADEPESEHVVIIPLG